MMWTTRRDTGNTSPKYYKQLEWWVDLKRGKLPCWPAHLLSAEYIIGSVTLLSDSFTSVRVGRLQVCVAFWLFLDQWLDAGVAEICTEQQSVSLAGKYHSWESNLSCSSKENTKVENTSRFLFQVQNLILDKSCAPYRPHCQILVICQKLEFYFHHQIHSNSRKCETSEREGH